MKQLGDITKIHGYDIAPVDCITGGSPCQDLSTANGKREGLAGERSGLFLHQIRITKEMRQHDRENGRTGAHIRPRYMVWENVAGVYSSNGGKDFAAVLEEVVRVEEPKAPTLSVPKGGWPRAGCLYDDLGRWSVAFRLHDAQFWGVPQRRTRIALVADFGGLSAPEILFERQGLRWDSQPGETREEATPRGTGAGAGSAICIAGNIVQRPDTANCNGKGWREDISYTLNTLDRHAVMCLNDQGGGVMDVSQDKTGTLRAEAHGHEPAILAFTQNQRNEVRDLHNVAGALAAEAGVKQRTHVMVYGLNCWNGRESEDLCNTLQAKESGGYSLNCTHPIRIGTSIRRLTPLECERLQGYPDHWTEIGEPVGCETWTDENGTDHTNLIYEYIDSKGKRRKTSDSARYRALGNSIALPFWFWLLRRISAQYERPATLGSLFDGIGGFPLCWERCNGKGTALWASEIDEFAMAVTRSHFPDEPPDTQEP